jgi:hypothetical protein
MSFPILFSNIIYVGFGGGLLALVFLLIAFRSIRRERLIRDLPTCKTTGVFIGTVELKGTAESDAPISSYLAGVPCVWFNWSVEEHYRRTRTVTTTDSKGNRQTKTETYTGWETVAHGGQHIPFYLKDEEGIIRVMPDGAKIEGDAVYGETVSQGHPLYYGKGPSGSVNGSTGTRRFTESAIRLHTPLYLLGHARLREDVVAPEIAYDKHAEMFLISTRSESSIASGYCWTYRILSVLGLVAAVVPWFFVLKDQPDKVAMAAVTAGASYVLAFLLGWLWVVYNSLVGLKKRVDQSWSNIDVQLKRRHDLIPNLVKVVEGYCGHERETQESLALLRSQASVTAPGTPGEDPRGCASRLIMLAEAYPTLKADQNFMKLQEQLIDTEQRIALAREYYNETIMSYNIRCETFPDMLPAKLAGMKPRVYFEAEDFERAAVQVKLVE